MFGTFLSMIDLVAIPVAMNFSGREKAKTKFGGLCSIIFFSFVLWTIIKGVQELFSTTNPTIISYESYTQDPREMAVSAETFPIAFQVRTRASLLYTPFINDKIYKLNILHSVLDRITHENGTLEERWTEDTIASEKCSLDHFGELASSFADLDLNYTFCIARKQPVLNKISLQGAFISPVYQAITVQIVKCKNDTVETLCAPEETINDYLSGSWFTALFTNMVVNPKDYAHPDFKFRDQYYTMLNPENYRETEIELGRVEVATDKGLLGENINVDNYFKVNKVTEFLQFDPNSDGIIIACIFQLSKLENYYSRSYKKITEVLAQVGSLANTSLIVLLVITTPYFKIKFRESLMNELFYIRKLEKTDVRQNFKHRYSYDCPNQEDNEELENNQKIHYQNHGKLRRKSKTQQQRYRVSKFYERKGPRLSKLGNNQEKVQDTRMEFKANISETRSYVVESTPTLEKKDNETRKVYKESKVETDKRNTNNLQSDNGSLIDMKESKAKNGNIQSILASHKEKSSPLEKKIFEDDNPEHPNFSCGNLETKMNNAKTQIEIKAKEIINQQKTGEINLAAGQQFLGKGDAEDHKMLVVKDHMKINLQFWEYVISFFYRPAFLKDKFKILNEGAERVSERLDVKNILKKLREVDKLIALLLDEDQLRLFHNLPKPEICYGMSGKFVRQSSFSNYMLRTAKTIEEEHEKEQKFLESYKKIRTKQKKTKIDEKLLRICEEENE